MRERRLSVSLSYRSALSRADAAAVSPPPDADDEFEHHFNQPSYGKHGRTPPPVDTDAASELPRLSGSDSLAANSA